MIIPPYLRESGSKNHRDHRHVDLGSRDVSRAQVVDARTPGVHACHKQDEFIERIERALGVDVGDVTCHLVDPSAMGEVMKKHGWNRNDAQGVVGFQVNDRIFVLKSAPWTVLHELVHKAGVNSDRLSRFVAEGLTEVIAAELKESPDEHRPTYPTEVSWIRGTLLPLLGMTGIQLGSVIAKSKDPPRDLAALIAAKKPGIDRAQLLDDLRPQRPDQPSFKGSVNRAATVGSGWAVGIGAAFLTAGVAILMASSGGSE